MNDNQVNTRIVSNQKRAYGTLTYQDLLRAYEYFGGKCEKFVKMLHELKIIICENVTSFILIFSQKVLIIIISKNVTFLIKYLLVI